MRKKVAYFCEELSPYRISIIERLAKEHELTVYCQKYDISGLAGVSFSVVKVPIIKKGPFIKYEISDFYRLCSSFDVVIGLSNLRHYQMMLFCLLPKTFKLALWGIGVTGSYTKRFASWSLATCIRVLITRFSDALIFYSERPVAMYQKVGYKKSKMFVAHNTVDNIVEMNLSVKRDLFLFVGTLYKAKGLEELINVYQRASFEQGNSFPKLVIIGGGELLDTLSNLILTRGLSDRVELTGPIYEQQTLKNYFDRAIFCVSPTQAGLSVLTSMSYGVPFVTCNDAFTGGELLNIKSGYNGIIMNKVDDLIDIFHKGNKDREKFLEMGRNAFNHYRKSRHPDMMAREIIRCVEEI